MPFAIGAHDPSPGAYLSLFSRASGLTEATGLVVYLRMRTVSFFDTKSYDHEHFAGAVFVDNPSCNESEKRGYYDLGICIPGSDQLARPAEIIYIKVIEKVKQIINR